MFGIINVIGLAFKPLAKFQAVIRVDVIVDSKNLTDKEIEDLQKAKWYLEDEIKLRSGKDTSDQAQIHALKEEIALNKRTIAELTDKIHRLKRLYPWNFL